MTNVKFDIPNWVNWLARDKNNGLYGYFSKPEKFATLWGVTGSDDYGLSYIGSDLEHYPQVKWEDEEPKPFKDGITLTYEPSELDTNEASITLANYGRFAEDAPTTEPIPEPDMIQNPPHYKQYTFEPIDIITEVVKEYPPEIGFHVGTVLKYLFRSPFKGKQEEDLEKAKYYLERAIKELTDE